jgi:hypothetical protein
MAKVYINDTADKINVSGKNALNAFAQGDEQRMMLMGLKRFTKTTPLNTIESRRIIADVLINENKYCFSNLLIHKKTGRSFRFFYEILFPF